MKPALFLLLGLMAPCMLAVHAEERTRRGLSFEWLWDSDTEAPKETDKKAGIDEPQDAKRAPNRTPKTRCSIEGDWYNHLGSEMIINSTLDSGMVHGEYRTAVERKYGSAGEGPSRLIGHVSTNDDQPTFGLTVVWRNGGSVSSWTGQCLLSDDGEEMLLTTWILTARIDNVDEYWMANRIGQDKFTRHEQKHGPRRDDNTHTPRDVARHLTEERLDDQLDL